MLTREDYVLMGPAALMRHCESLEGQMAEQQRINLAVSGENTRLRIYAVSLADALRLVLPMARSHAARHPVGSNLEYVAQADEALGKFEICKVTEPGGVNRGGLDAGGEGSGERVEGPQCNRVGAGDCPDCGQHHSLQVGVHASLNDPSIIRAVCEEKLRMAGESTDGWQFYEADAQDFVGALRSVLAKACAHAVCVHEWLGSFTEPPRCAKCGVWKHAIGPHTSKEGSHE